MATAHKPAIEQVLDILSVSQLATACNVSKQAVYKWIRKGHVPAERCLDIEEAVGGRVSRFDLLPPPFHKPATRRVRSRNTP